VKFPNRVIHIKWKSETNGSDRAKGAAYWSANLRLIYWSLAIWALCSFGFGILLRPMFRHFSGVLDLVFWFAQQGLILVFPFA